MTFDELLSEYAASDLSHVEVDGVVVAVTEHKELRVAGVGEGLAGYFRRCDTSELVRQIGRMNVFAISGGRVQHRETGVTLPVGSGYSVTVDLAGNDTYTVRRVFKRGAKVWVKGEQSEVYCEDVGEQAYQASSFRSYDYPKGGA